MDKNVFINNNNAIKYNPDINNTFIKNLDSRKANDYKHSNVIWKGITGDDFNKPIKSAKDLIIDFEIIDSNTIINKHNEEFEKRNMERFTIEQKNKIVREMAMADSMQLDFIDDNINENEKQDIKMHNELKTIQISENDILKNEKEKFNKLMKDLEDII
jgi:hypothetical protein